MPVFLSVSPSGGAIHAVRKIDMLQPELEKCLETLHALNAEKTRLILLYSKKEDIESKVFFYREIKEYTQEKICH